MLKNNELRIGNIIEWNKSIFNVCKISEDSIENELWCKPLTEIHPIPLTEQWLLRFGFVSNPYQDRYELGKIHIQCDKTKGTTDLWIEGASHIKYVHSLQNYVFALTGQELELK